MKKAALILIFSTIVTLIVPIIITYSTTGMANTGLLDEIRAEYRQKEESRKIKINLKDSKSGTLIEMTLDEYITLVVSSEIPITYEAEMIKAVAVCVRTYAYKRLLTRAGGDEVIISLPYVSKEDLRAKWGDSFNESYNRIKGLVEDTGASIIVYENEPIEAIFHPVSCGNTEAYENVWGESIPYLVGVPSNQDAGAINYYNSVTVSKGEFVNILKSAIQGIIVTEDNILSQLQIAARTKNGYVKSLQIGNKTIDGGQFKEIFGLSSTSFTIEEREGKMVIMAHGVGHGVGLSLYGANVLAANGYSFQEIINTYYTNVKIKSI